jgi:signal transduction histidine kinase
MAEIYININGICRKSAKNHVLVLAMAFYLMHIHPLSAEQNSFLGDAEVVSGKVFHANQSKDALALYTDSSMLIEDEKDIQLADMKKQISVQKIVIISIAGFILLLVIFIITILRFLKERHNHMVQLELYYQEISRQKEELMRKTEKLQKANDEISAINENQEVILIQSTEKIREQNRRLREYAYMNAHTIRGPLARVLGLVYIFKLGHLSEAQREVLDKLEFSALELDGIIRDLGDKLSQEPGFWEYVPQRSNSKYLTSDLPSKAGTYSRG